MSRETLIEIKNFSKSFGEFHAVKNLSMEVYEGEIFGFLGRNGAGKTTTIRTLIGIYCADQGEIRIFGREFDREMKSSIGYLPEERGLYVRSVVSDMIHYMAMLRGLDRKTALERAKSLMTMFSLWEHRNKRIQNLSSGMQQKVQIINSIIHKPRLLILDEPFRGLDPVNRQIVFDLLVKLRSEGTTILFSSHQIAEIEDICDRVIMISSGESKAYGTIEEIKSRWEPRCIHLDFSGELILPPHTKILKNDGNHAEIHYSQETDSPQVLKFLVDSGIQIEKYEVSRPSLHQIFLELCKDGHE